MTPLRFLDAVLALLSLGMTAWMAMRGEPAWAAAWWMSAVFCAASCWWRWADRLYTWSRRFLVVSALRRTLGG
ncbi:MAG: hypothetical protein ACYDHY_12860 [Acidiferrobacterales bacterium]